MATVTAILKVTWSYDHTCTENFCFATIVDVFFLSLPLCLFTMLIAHVTYQNDFLNDGVIMRQNQLVLPTPVKTNAQE